MSWLKQHYLFILLGSLIVLTSALNFFPSAKESAKRLVLGNKREILSQVEADFTGKGDRFQIVKVKTLDSLSLEIYYFSESDSKLTFKSRIVLPDTQDGFFEFSGQSTNLLATDIDSDGVLEVIAPTYDKNLSPRMNVFKYNPQDQSFERVEANSFL